MGIFAMVCSSAKNVGLLHALHAIVHPDVDGVRIAGNRWTNEAEGFPPEISDDGRESAKYPIEI